MCRVINQKRKKLKQNKCLRSNCESRTVLSVHIFALLKSQEPCKTARRDLEEIGPEQVNNLPEITQIYVMAESSF